MKILYELSWLWGTLGIALLAAAVCVACAALIGRAAKHWYDTCGRIYRKIRCEVKSGKNSVCVDGTARFGACTIGTG